MENIEREDRLLAIKDVVFNMCTVGPGDGRAGGITVNSRSAWLHYVGDPGFCFVLL